MEFRFDLRNIFKTPIARIGNSLLPFGFIGADRRAALDATAYVAEIINTVGMESAKAQGLNQAVTTAERLRNSEDQIIYLMTEDNADKNGLVIGLLKVGRKSLYVFDKNGDTRHVMAPCILDFWVHESRRRLGFGKVLFEQMLDTEGLVPEKMAVDRPSEKLLGFLKKHYGLHEKIPQMNNFVLYEGFFESQHVGNGESNGRVHVTSSPNTNLFGPQYIDTDHKRRTSRQFDMAPAVISQESMGRYGARRPQCSISQIIHNKPSGNVRAEPNSSANNVVQSIEKHKIAPEMPRNTVDDDEFYNEQTAEQIIADDLASQMDHLEVQGGDERPLSPTPSSQMSVHFANEFVDSEDTCDSKREIYHHEHEQPFYEHHRKHQYHQGFRPDAYTPAHHKLTKQHTGMKNISSGVGGAVRLNGKMDFDQEKNEGYGVVKINRPIGLSTKRNTKEDLMAANDLESNHSGSDYAATHTAEGYLDLKFYHNPLW